MAASRSQRNKTAHQRPPLANPQGVCLARGWSIVFWNHTRVNLTMPREYIDWLQVGQAIVSLKDRIQVPLHVAFPRIAVRKGLITDENIGRTT